MSIVTGAQIRAARALLGWDQAELAERANVSVKTVKRMEQSDGNLEARSDWSVKKALERGGVEFFGEHDWRNRSDGVRFAEDRTGRLREEMTKHVKRSLECSLKSKTDEDPDFFERPLEFIVDALTPEFRETVKDTVQLLLHKSPD
jgi:transcriptional regulator with XRE-family HTH domain